MYSKIDSSSSHGEDVSNIMTSKTSNQSQPIDFCVRPSANNDTGFEFPLSPSEPGKFDFYRVHLTNQPHRKDSILSPDPIPIETSNPIPQTLKSHFPTKLSATDADLLPKSSQISNKPIQTVASFSSLTDAVKNAMQRGTIGAGMNPLRRPASGTTLSSKDLNHLSPQSM